MSAFKRHYAASPLHLLAHLALFALVLAVIMRLVDARESFNILVWFLAAIVLHDALFLPAYSALDRVSRTGLAGTTINYVRVPAVIAGALFLVWFPSILGRADGSVRYLTGSDPSGAMAAYLVICAVLFGGSLLLALVRLRGRG